MRNLYISNSFLCSFLERAIQYHEISNVSSCMEADWGRTLYPGLTVGCRGSAASLLSEAQTET